MLATRLRIGEPNPAYSCLGFSACRAAATITFGTFLRTLGLKSGLDIGKTCMRFWWKLRDYWQSEAGPREVLILALPLVLSTASFTIQVFVDRVFLTWYSQDAIAAVVPAVCVFWVLMGPLQAIVSFANTFVAQYHGAGRHDRIGSAVGQATLLAVVGGAAMFALWPLAGPIFRWVGHEPAVQDLEIEYFRILLFWSVPMLVLASTSSFFGGLGRTWVVLILNVVATVINIVLDYAMIFGHWGFPRMGVAGAGWASAIAFVAAAGLSLVLLWAADERREFRVRAAASWLPDMELQRRMLRFGGPNGAMALIDVLAWTWFILFIGELGTPQLAATNVVLNINMIAFLPLMGLSTATQIIVGQRLGRDRPDLAARATWSAFWLGLAFTLPFGVGYLAVPEWFLTLFVRDAGSAELASWHEPGIVLLRFVVAYMIFDMTTLIFAGALRGAGDTRFVMTAIFCLSIVVLVGPTYVACELLSGGLNAAWSFLSLYVMALGVAFFIRFQSGAWRSMRVIEPDLIDSAPLACPSSN